MVAVGISTTLWNDDQHIASFAAWGLWVHLATFCDDIGSDHVSRRRLFRVVAGQCNPFELAAELRDIGLLTTHPSGDGWNLSPRFRMPQISTKPRTTRVRRDRQKLIERDGGICQKCRVLGSDLPDGEVLQVDHRVPIARGGTEALENKQLLCRACNLTKGASA